MRARATRTSSPPTAEPSAVDRSANARPARAVAAAVGARVDEEHLARLAVDVEVRRPPATALGCVVAAVPSAADGAADGAYDGKGVGAAVGAAAGAERGVGAGTGCVVADADGADDGGVFTGRCAAVGDGTGCSVVVAASSAVTPVTFATLVAAARFGPR